MVNANQNANQTERNTEGSDQSSHLVTAGAIGLESGLYPFKPPQWNGRSNRRQVGEVLLISTVVAAVMAIVHLLLVMSGDVEENPGPLGQHTKDPTFTLRNVLNALKDVMDWKSLGDQLNINAPKINEIEVNNQRQVADCRRDLVQFWLESDVSCSWKKLIDTLKAIDQSVLAEEIRTTYCPTYQGATPIEATPTDATPTEATLKEATPTEATPISTHKVKPHSVKSHLQPHLQRPPKEATPTVTPTKATPTATPTKATVRGAAAIAGGVVGVGTCIAAKFATAGVLVSCGVGGVVGIGCAVVLYSVWKAHQKDQESLKEKKEK